MEAASARERKRPRQGDASEGDARMREVWDRLLEAAARKPQYTYLPIADTLKVPGVLVSLFAVVAEIGAAVHSSGTDFTVTLRIVDQSRKAVISATFFAETIDLLPCVKSSGDVISLHNVVIKKHHELFVAFDKRFSSFALFESKVSAECSPYQTSMKYHGSKHDKERITQLRTWLPLGLKDLGLKDLELQLRSLKSDSTFDLVLHVRENSGKWIFYVWDGTDTPAAEFQAISDAEAVAGPPLPREVLCTMPCVGTVLRVFSDSPVKQELHMREGIYWARFCNITCKQEFGIWKGEFLKSSRVRLLSHEDGSVVDRLKIYDSRNANKVHRQPMASFPSNIAGDARSENLGPRVVAFYPCQAHDLHLLLPLNDVYSIRLTLEDPTTRIDAFVHKDDLEKFFGPLVTVEVILEKMNKLLGVIEAEDEEEIVPLTMNPPWIWCVLASYYREKNDPWGSRRHRIIDTRIRD